MHSLTKPILPTPLSRPWHRHTLYYSSQIEHPYDGLGMVIPADVVVTWYIDPQDRPSIRYNRKPLFSSYGNKNIQSVTRDTLLFREDIQSSIINQLVSR